MLTAADNATITAVGPGTPMGRLLREYWIPALRSDELAGNLCHPVRVLLLGEKLIAFRDSQGAAGLLSHACPHRGASLFFGRNEEGGIRCAYHGWKFNVGGECVDMPCEPSSVMRRQMRTTAYPCVERGGVVWAYLGTRTSPPPLPNLEMNLEGAGSRGRVDLSMMECNWLQNLEGDIDVDHVGVLHGGNFEAFERTLAAAQHPAGAPVRAREDSRVRYSTQRLPLEVVDSEVGCSFASHLTAGARALCADSQIEPPQLWAVGQFMFPFYAMLPYGTLGAHWVVARVPMDDQHTMTFGMYAPGSAIPSRELMFGRGPPHLPQAAGWHGRFRLTRNPDTDFGLDRELAGTSADAFGLGAAIAGQAIQDSAITYSMGRVADRSREHLGPGDVVIARVRKRLLHAARALIEGGTPPPGVDTPDGYRKQQGMVRVRRGRTWREESVR